MFNVLRGEMSIVGPRPTLRYQVDQYTPVPAAAARGQAGDHRLGADPRPQQPPLARADRARRLVRRAPVAAPGPRDPAPHRADDPQAHGRLQRGAGRLGRGRRPGGPRRRDARSPGTAAWPSRAPARPRRALRPGRRRRRPPPRRRTRPPRCACPRRPRRPCRRGRRRRRSRPRRGPRAGRGARCAPPSSRARRWRRCSGSPRRRCGAAAFTTARARICAPRPISARGEMTAEACTISGSANPPLEGAERRLADLRRADAADADERLLDALLAQRFERLAGRAPPARRDGRPFEPRVVVDQGDDLVGPARCDRLQQRPRMAAGAVAEDWDRGVGHRRKRTGQGAHDRGQPQPSPSGPRSHAGAAVAARTAA